MMPSLRSVMRRAHSPRRVRRPWRCGRHGRRTVRSVRVGEFGLGVFLRVFLVGDDGLLRDALAAVEVLQRLEGERAEARVGLDDARDPTVEDALYGALGPVDRDDLDVAG